MTGSPSTVPRRLPASAARSRTAQERDARAHALRAWVAADLPAKVADWPEEWREIWEERSAIMEYDGGLPRPEAKRQAEERVRLEHARAHSLSNPLVVEPPAEDAVAGIGQGTARTGGP
ncbi:MAG: hypothetical protein JXA87_06780 [Thermoleophilia bacterium]|nr:hypothetical protein [Thermoleophilia bacterium]